MTEPTLVPLNRTEHMFWAGEGYLGSITQPYLLRFDGPVDAALVRQALRELTSAYPRLRGVIVPTARQYKLQILPDDLYIDQLVDDAFRVVQGVDASSGEALRAYQNELLNESISMERGLAWRARLIPHPTQAAFIFSLHHIIGDGRSLLQLIMAILGRLNGKPIKPCPLQRHDMIPAVAPTSWTKWPASILGFWRNQRKDALAAKDTQLITLATRQSPRFTTPRIYHYELPCGLAQLRALAKPMGVTVNNLMAALLANAFLARDKDNPKAVATIRMSYDVRRLFPKDAQPEIGNFVVPLKVYARHQPTLIAQIQSIEAQVKDYMGRYDRREYALPLLSYELLHHIGRRLYSLMILRAKQQGKLQDVSCHFTNLGAADFINAPDTALRVTEFWPMAQPMVMLIGMLTLGDKVYIPMLHPQDEIEAPTVASFLQTFERELLALAPQPV